MKTRPLSLFAFVLLLADVASTQVRISIGIRETQIAGGSFTAIGGNGGSSGAIEWIDLDAQTLVLDGVWRQFTFLITNGNATAFTGNGFVDGMFGTLEHVRVSNAGGETAPLSIWIDDIADTVRPGGGSPVTTVFGDFEASEVGQEAMFRHPGFSPSTSGNLVSPESTTALIDAPISHSHPNSTRFRFQFVDGSPTRWARLTTFSSRTIPNPLIRFDQFSVVTFWMAGVRGTGSYTAIGGGCPSSRGVAPGNDAAALPVIGQTFTMQIGNAPINQPISALLIGFVANGGIDLGVIGMPKCPLHLDPVQARAAPTDSNGTALVPLWIPRDLTLVGRVFYTQPFVADPGINTLGAVTGIACRGVIGPPQ